MIRLYYRGLPSICVILRRWPPLQDSYAHGLGGDSDRTSLVVRLAWRRQVSALAWGVVCAVAVVGLPAGHGAVAIT